MLEQAAGIGVRSRGQVRATTRTRSFMARVIEGAPVVVLEGELDMASGDAFWQAIVPALERGGPVVVDLTNLRFMDSSGIHLLLRAAKRLDGTGCLFLHGVHEPVDRVLDLVGIAAVQNIHLMACDMDPSVITS
jgi:anti-sigma B factor antagonist